MSFFHLLSPKFLCGCCHKTMDKKGKYFSLKNSFAINLVRPLLDLRSQKVFLDVAGTKTKKSVAVG
jgi:hypothetical protein